MQRPNIEQFYQWKEFLYVEGEDKCRLLTPWADPMRYEYPMDFMFESIEQAKQVKFELAPDEYWILVKVTYEPLKE